MLYSLSPSYKLAYVASHHRKERPTTRLDGVGALLTEDGRRLTTEAGQPFAIGGIERPSWLPSLQDFKDELRITSTDASEDRHLNRLLDLAIDLVAAECGIDAEPTDYVGLVDADPEGYQIIKIDRSLVSEVSSVDTRESPEYEWEPLEFFVRWENGLAYVLREGEEAFDGNEVKVEYTRGITSTSKENRLFDAAVLQTAVGLYDNPSRADAKTIMRNPIYSALFGRLADRRSEVKWTT